MSSPASDDDAFQPMPERTLFTSGKVVAIYRVGFFTTILRRNQLNFPGCQRLLRGAKLCLMITPEEIVGEEWASWYRLSPQERWHESEKLWQVYFYLGGSLDAQPDTQSPFFDPGAPSMGVAHGRPGMRILRRSRV